MEAFNCIFVTKEGSGNFQVGTDNCDSYGRPYVQLYSLKDGVETPIISEAFADTVNTALGQALLPHYACFDSKLYIEQAIAGLSVGFILGLYE